VQMYIVIGPSRTITKTRLSNVIIKSTMNSFLKYEVQLSSITHETLQ